VKAVTNKINVNVLKEKIGSVDQIAATKNKKIYFYLLMI
jgi:hypothetical protein